MKTIAFLLLICCLTPLKAEVIKATDDFFHLKSPLKLKQPQNNLTTSSLMLVNGGHLITPGLVMPRI